MKKVTVRRCPVLTLKSTFARQIPGGVKHYHVYVSRAGAGIKVDTIGELKKYLEEEFNDEIDLEVLPTEYEVKAGDDLIPMTVEAIKDLSFLDEEVVANLKKKAFKSTVEVEYTWWSKLLQKIFSKKFFSRFGKLNTYRMAIFALGYGQEDEVAAWLQMSDDLYKIKDKIVGALCMPSTIDIVNISGNGKKVKALIVYPMVDERTYKLLKRDLQSRKAGVSFFKSTCQEGSIVYFRGKQPYSDQILEEVHIRTAQMDYKRV